MAEQDKSTKSLAATCRVFISYSHDSLEHQQRVLALANRLREDGVEAWIDQYIQDPNEGWIRWMRGQVRQAGRVLLVFTETYQRRFEGDEEEGEGLGATFEGVIVTQALYESGGRNAKFRPVVFSEQEETFIPEELRRFNRYRVDTQDNYQNLLRWLYEAPRIVVPKVGDRPDLPPESAPKLFPTESSENTAKNLTGTVQNLDSAIRASQEALRWDSHLGHTYRSEGTEIYTEAVQFTATNVSSKPVRLEHARVISAITGATAEVGIGTAAGWVRPSDINPIPTNSTVTLQVKFNPPTGLAAQELINSWGTMRLSVTYDGATHEVPIGENMTRALFANFRPNPLEPRVTLAVSKQTVDRKIISRRAQPGQKSKANDVFLCSLGIVLLLIPLCFVVFVPNSFQKAEFYLRVITALGGAFVGAAIPGFLKIDFPGMRAGGALAIFALIFLVNPPKLTYDGLSSRPRLIESLNRTWRALYGEKADNFLVDNSDDAAVNNRAATIETIMYGKDAAKNLQGTPLRDRIAKKILPDLFGPE